MTLPSHVRGAITTLRKWARTPFPENLHMEQPIELEALPQPIADLLLAVAKAWDETPEAERIKAGQHVVGLHANGAVIIRRVGVSNALGTPIKVG